MTKGTPAKLFGLIIANLVSAFVPENNNFEDNYNRRVLCVN